MPENYGCVSLKLPPTWSRGMLASGQDFQATTIGHEGGVSDARLIKEPEKKHEFAWCADSDFNRIGRLKAKKFQPLSGKGTWEFNKDLPWEMDGEGTLSYLGQRLWFRDGELYFKEERERQEAEKREADARRKRRLFRGMEPDDADEYAIRALGARGVEVTDQNGRPLRPLAKG